MTQQKDFSEKSPKVLSERLIFESRKFRLYEQEMIFPDGHTETWEFVSPKWKAGVQILAITEGRELIFVREFRGAAAKFVLRLPTGSLEPGETPSMAAQRELVEEVGFRAGQLQLLEERKSTSSYYRGKLYVFLATHLEAVPLRRDPGEQTMGIVPIPLEQAFSMAENVEIEGEGTVYSLLWLRRYLREHPHLLGETS